MIDYQVILVSFPDGKTKESVTKNEDDSYTIFIESSLSKDEQQRRCLHALKHITNNDFNTKGTNADEIERIAHQCDYALELCF